MRRELWQQHTEGDSDVGQEQWKQHTGGDSDVGQEETH